MSYLIWSNEHRAWWRHASQGYTPHIGQAGIYSREQAMEICRNALMGSREVPHELPVAIKDLDDMGAGEWVMRTEVF